MYIWSSPMIFRGYLTIIVSDGILFDEPDLGLISNNKWTLVATFCLFWKSSQEEWIFIRLSQLEDKLDISQQVGEEKRLCPLKLSHKFRFLGGKAEFSLPNLQSPSFFFFFFFFFFPGRKHWWSIVASTGW